MIRRSIRTGFRIGVLAGIAFALFKLVQSRRSSSLLSSGSEWAAPPTRTGRSGETPLVDPHMLQGVSLKKPAAQTQAGQESAPVGSPPAVAQSESASRPTGSPLPQGRQEAAAAPARKAAGKKAAGKKAAGKKAAPAAGRAKKAAKVARKAAATWVDPKGAFCPSSHPVKAKLSSGIYHLPGMAAYERTNADRCYPDEDTAQSDGLRKAKR